MKTLTVTLFSLAALLGSIPSFQSVVAALSVSTAEVPRSDEAVASADQLAEEAWVSTIVFSSNRLGTLDLYWMDVDENGIPLVDENGVPFEPRQLTGPGVNDLPAGNNGLPDLSPDGKGRIVFESTRNRAPGEPVNQADLFWMNTNGKDQRQLTRGSSVTWSPNGKYIAFHRSASNTPCPPAPRPPGLPGCPIKFPDPGAATFDSDIFVVNVGALLDEDCLDDDEASSADEDCNDKNPMNLTNTEDFIEDDPDWSPEGLRIAFTRHPVAGPHLDSFSAEMHVLDLETGTLEQVTDNDEEERGAAWSPDGRRIAYMCRRGNPLNPQTLRPTTFEICVMDLENRDPSGFPITTRLTSNVQFEGGPHWSPDGKKIVFGRTESAGLQQLWVMDLENLDVLGFPVATQLTLGPDTKLFANWGERRRRPQ